MNEFDQVVAGRGDNFLVREPRATQALFSRTGRRSILRKMAIRVCCG